MYKERIKRCAMYPQHHKKLMSLLGLFLLIALALVCKFVLFSGYSPFSEKTISYHNSASDKAFSKSAQSSSAHDDAQGKQAGQKHASKSSGKYGSSHSSSSPEANDTNASRNNHNTQNFSAAQGPTFMQRDITVYVSGAVNAPGVYTLKTPARVDDALAQAGGFSDAADRDRVNLAQKLSDGQHVYIPRAGETASAEGARTRSRSSSAQSRRKTSSAPSQSAVQSADISADNPLNLNSASKEELMQLKGVGASLAQRILDYRSMRGSFHSKEELLMIAGIGEKMYAQIENIICL